MTFVKSLIPSHSCRLSIQSFRVHGRLRWRCFSTNDVGRRSTVESFRVRRRRRRSRRASGSSRVDSETIPWPASRRGADGRRWRCDASARGRRWRRTPAPAAAAEGCWTTYGIGARSTLRRFLPRRRRPVRCLRRRRFRRIFLSVSILQGRRRRLQRRSSCYLFRVWHSVVVAVGCRSKDLDMSSLFRYLK